MLIKNDLNQSSDLGLTWHVSYHNLSWTFCYLFNIPTAYHRSDIVMWHTQHINERKHVNLSFWHILNSLIFPKRHIIIAGFIHKRSLWTNSPVKHHNSLLFLLKQVVINMLSWKYFYNQYVENNTDFKLCTSIHLLKSKRR